LGVAESVNDGDALPPATVTVTDTSVSTPAELTQRRTKLPEPPNGPTDSLPASGFSPDQFPLARHEVAPAELQVSSTMDPAAIDVEFAVMLTSGDGPAAALNPGLTRHPGLVADERS
jgi:hypothetical protein